MFLSSEEALPAPEELLAGGWCFQLLCFFPAGVATIMAVLELPSTAKLPPIEALFTVDEETGLTGAFQVGLALSEESLSKTAPAIRWFLLPHPFAAINVSIPAHDDVLHTLHSSMAPCSRAVCC